MKRIFFLFTLLLSLSISLNVFSQTDNSATNCSVKGVLVDSITSETIPYVTISVSSVNKPAVYLKRMAADLNGNFEVILKNTDTYFISFESVGMRRLIKKVNVSNQKTLNLGKINMSVSDAKLSEVTVLASKPLVKVELDKISYDTKSDPESQSSNVLDMLRKVPLVTVDGEDNIQLKGSSNFKVYVNGKPSSMTATNPSQVLKSMPASSIKTVEVITDPGAKYEAEGLGGIINIVTERAMAGYTGTIRTGVDSKGGYTGGLYFSTKRKKFGITSNLNFNKHIQPNQYYEVKRENVAGASSSRYMNQKSEQDMAIHYFYGNIEASYEFDSLNLISLSIGGHSGGHNVKATAETGTFNDQRDTLMAYNQYTEATGTWGGVETTLDYQRSFKKPDQLFTLSYKLSNTPNNTDNYSEFTALKNYFNSKQRIASIAQGNEHTFQADYVEPFNKIHTLELGTKYILRLNNSENSYRQFNGEINDWEDIAGRATKDMNHTQNILGAYGSYTLKLKKVSLKGGVRLEHTTSKVEFIESPAEDFSVKFTNFVPSAAVTYKLNDMSNLRLTYNQRISRPGISYLNPFIDDSNPQAITQGNPDLDPEINNSFSLNYGQFTPKVNFNASLFTSFTNNSIERLSQLQSTGVIYTTYKNIGYNSNTGLSLYGNVMLNKAVRLNANGQATYLKLATNDGSGIENSGIRYTLSGGAQFILPWELKLNLNGGYYSPGISLQGKNPAFHYSTLSLAKDFLKKKLNIALRVQDPFESTKKLLSISETNLYYQTTDVVMAGRYFGLNVSYSFGEMKEQVKKAKRTITNDDVKAADNQNTSTQQ
ncbi:MAG TPA: outer membrane beta-barrel family protein [Paludibacter sp.]|nr:outer membrane beta-barrel family protein [Paludibacter sp.]